MSKRKPLFDTKTEFILLVLFLIATGLFVFHPRTVKVEIPIEHNVTQFVKSDCLAVVPCAPQVVCPVQVQCTACPACMQQACPVPKCDCKLEGSWKSEDPNVAYWYKNSQTNSPTANYSR